MHPILLIVFLLITLFGISWFKRLPAQKRNEGLRKLLIYGGALALIVLVVTGRLNPLFALLGGAIPLIYRAHGAYRLLRGVQGAFQGGRPSNAGPGSATRSVVRSKYLEMTLDHASGAIGGVVLQGMNAGDNLSGLSLEALLAMRAHYKNDDPQSLSLLDAYLDQVHEGWHAHCADPEDSDASASHAPMSASEASEMLGVPMDATPEEIREAHRRLMQKLHPDRGGSTYLAAKVNIAKQVLLKHVDA